MKSGIFTIVFLLSTIRVFSSDLKFYSISDLYGNSVKETYSICKVGKGSVWGAAKTGIIRFSENNYRIYDLPYKTADVFLTRLICDNSLLIAYTNNGKFFSYDVLYDRFKFFIDLREILNYRHLVVLGINLRQ